MQDEDEDRATTTTTTTFTMTTAIILVLMLLFLPSMVVGDDASIMLDLFKSLNLTPRSWSRRPTPCKWRGVGCNSLGQVTSISLPSSSIFGTLPPSIVHLSNLQTLSLQSNHISGSIPTLSNMTHLKEVVLNNNHFTHLDSSFCFFNLPSLETFIIDNNPLDPWILPEGLSGLTSLREFHASNANLVGPIPNIFHSLPNLQDLKISYNSLTGPLPPSFAGSRIQTLWINNQKQGLSGSLDVLGYMPNLAQVWAQGNAFVGRIPNLSNCTALFDLQLGDNRLYGTLPPSIFSLPNLLNVSLRNNMFQGPIPIFSSQVKVTLGSTHTFCSVVSGTPCDAQVTALLTIADAFNYPPELAQSWLGSDPCDNWVGVTCDSLRVKVIVLNFARKNLTGFISPAFANLTSLTSIILNDNSLIGAIPDNLTSLKMLQKLDVSNNNLTGKVPNFTNNVIVNAHGNPLLGSNMDTSGAIKSPPRFSNTNLPCATCSVSQFSSWQIVGIIGCSTILVVVVVVLTLPFLKRKGKNYGLVNASVSEKMTKQEETSKISLNDQCSEESRSEYSCMINLCDPGNVIDIPIEVILEATNNFSDENILGRGGFGVVYRGILHDGSIVAVKRMDPNLERTNAMAEFQSEIAVLSEVRHRHLLALLGYCIDKEERIMVYEFMAQGTLEQHLFECEERGLPPLCWKQRIVIALDVARGVEYLHSLAQQSFIHRDLKPSNILLDEDMRAKVADFGLVKNAPDKGNYSVETRLAGTFGYLAPEYASRVTTKIDVFSFGVVLMELITGRKALDDKLPEDESQLVTWFKRVVLNAQEDITKAIDPQLKSETDQVILDSINQVAELSGYCTAWEPHQRPDMSHIVNILAPLVDHWRPINPSVGSDANGVDHLAAHRMSLPQALLRWRAGESTTDSSRPTDSRSCYFSARSSLMVNNSFSTAVQDLSPEKATYSLGGSSWN
ncbi:hypothetical protein Cgig2_029931 [Carnegiea gigantea]|uniref:Protein kinase domain-containing protein n=1 Tax=Carnegiea gigantea TaxID=171969 RepID=A0A9Q1JP41_9CARY|nr:hypothetical protein Cgig2_029931 [Carnegiea gigantea]